MTAPLYNVADFQRGMLALFPRGRVWSRLGDSTLAKVVRGLVGVYERSTTRAAQLIAEVFPPSTYELLPQWEASLGLPDPCQGLSPGIVPRRDQVVARFVADGGQTKAYYIAVAAKLGYSITIDEFVPARFGMLFGSPFGGDAWAHTWRVNAPQFTIARFTFGASAMGEPFATWGNAVLQCELNRLALAHTILLFNYS